MAPVHDPRSGVVNWNHLVKRLEELYRGDFLEGHAHHQNAKAAQQGAALNIAGGPIGDDPSVAIPQILVYLRDNDGGRDEDWHHRFSAIKAYVSEAYRQMTAGDLGYSEPKIRGDLEYARVMVKVHEHFEKRAQKNTPWTTAILRSQTKQKRLLTFPKGFPQPVPDRSKSQYRPVKPTPRPTDDTKLWSTSLKITEMPDPTGTVNEFIPVAPVPEFTEVDNYVESENELFRAIQQQGKSDKLEQSQLKGNRFHTSNSTYEYYISSGAEEICSRPPPRDPGTVGPAGPDNPDGHKGPSFYRQRGWQRAALQQCLNLFTSHENRVINTPWRRLVLPYEQPVPLPKEIAFVPRVADPDVVGKQDKDPFSWLHWSSQYTQTVDFLAGCQRKRYNYNAWDNFSASELPVNFRGPHVYRGLAVYDQHMLKVGRYLENLESMIHDAWGAAPRPLLRAILRDIDAGRLEIPPVEDGGSDGLDIKRRYRRDIKRRYFIDTIDDKASVNDDYKLVDEYDMAWLRYLCEPSRTLEMCDPSKLPAHNLATLFDAKLQSYFRDREVSGTPDSKALHIWTESRNEIDGIMREYKPSTVIKALAYINGCKESEIRLSGNDDANSAHPNGCYQFSLEEAEFLCVELEMLGRCIFIPGMKGEPSTVDRPAYNVHPEDRVAWRYMSAEHFRQESPGYLKAMLDHYNANYASWITHKPNRSRFSRELEFMLDHAGEDFRYELQALETRDTHATDSEIQENRLRFIEQNLVPEGLIQIGDSTVGNVELERDSPYWEDLASWEQIGAYLTKFHEQQQKKENSDHYRRNGIYQSQTAEKTVQFFRNLAYRMGRTMRHVEQIKDRLQYVEADPNMTPKPTLDLSEDLKDPRPEDSMDIDSVQAPVTVQKWWQAISLQDYDLAIEDWNTAVQEGAGEVTLLPPNIEDVLEKADPDGSFRNKVKGQDPFTVIREGIIDDCVQNRPSMYPGRLSGFKDQANKEFQGYVRPNLFEWATKDQRRYQAHHTRQDFFNMQRWPLSRLPPHRVEEIRNRKDEVLRKNPSKVDQAYGILTYRLPVGKEKPLYAHPLIEHHFPDNENLFGPRHQDDRNIFSNHKNGNSGNSNNTRGADINTGNSNNTGNTRVSNSATGNTNTGNANTGSVNTGNTNINAGNTNAGNNNLDTMETNIGNTSGIGNGGNKGNGNGNQGDGNNRNSHAKREFIPYQRSLQKFAPGPAVFPMGDTLLQKMMISQELSNALFPEQPFYKAPFMGLPKALNKITGAKNPLIPLVPPVSRSFIPRSNPKKRKMPIEFLNGRVDNKLQKLRRFQSHENLPQQPGGLGGQFAAGVEQYRQYLEKGKVHPGTKESATATEGTMPATTPKAATREGRKEQTSNVRLVTPEPDEKSAEKSRTTTRPHGLPILPHPPLEVAREQFLKDFPHGWASQPTTIQHLFPGAVQALAFSINSQIQEYHNYQTSATELQALARLPKCAILEPLTDIAMNNFDMDAVNFLLGALGEKEGFKFQLGIVQEDTPGISQKKYNAYLMGSQYGNDTDKIVIWIRLSEEKFPTTPLVNRFNGQSYNCYKGILRRKA